MLKKILALSIMILVAGLFSIFGCKSRRNNSTSNMTDTVTGAYFPTNHKLTAQERKEFSNKFLRQKGVPVLEHLPLIEDYTEAQFRNEKEIASKAVVLYGLIYCAHHEKTSKEMIDYFKKYHLWDHVSPDERQYLQKEKKTDEDNTAITWRIENLNVLLWALKGFDTLVFPTKMCDFSNYKNLPDPEVDPTEWINNSRLRDTEEILNETDLIYRIHWATRDASLKGKPLPAGLNEDIIMERHFALNWLIMYAEDWDDITTDT